MDAVSAAFGAVYPWTSLNTTSLDEWSDLANGSYTKYCFVDIQCPTNILGVALESHFLHCPIGTCMNAEHLNTRWCINTCFLPCQAMYGVLPTTDRVGVQWLRLTAPLRAKAQYFFKCPASSRLHHTYSRIVQFTRSATPLDWGVSGDVDSCTIPSDFAYSLTFLEVYSPPPSVQNHFTCLPDSSSLRAFHSLNFSRASDWYFNMYSSLCPVVRLVKSSIYPPPLMAVSSGPHLCKWTSSSRSVVHEVLGVMAFLAYMHLMQLSQLHFPVTFGALAVTFSMISKVLRPMCAKRQRHNIRFSAWCRNEYPVVLSASRQLSLSILIYSVDSGEWSRTRSTTRSPSTWGAVVINLPWRL